MLKKLCDCLSSVTTVDNGDVFIFSPELGGYSFEYQPSQLDYDYKLKIPFEDKTITLLFDEKRLKKFATSLGVGAKHFDVLIQTKEKIIENVTELLDCSESEFYFLTGGNEHFVSDLSVNTEPVKLMEIIDAIKQWIKSGSDESDPGNTKDWTDESINEQLVVYYYTYVDGIVTLGLGLKYKSSGWIIKCNRLGSFKPTIYPCAFKLMNQNEEYIPIIFDLYGITENKPTFKSNIDIQTNVSTIISEADDFIFDIKKKLKFELARSIDQDQYLKHLSTETKIPKRFIKKGIICGDTISSIVQSILNECMVLLHSNEDQTPEDYTKNISIVEKLCKSAGYAIFYQDRFCNCCYKTTTLYEES